MPFDRPHRPKGAGRELVDELERFDRFSTALVHLEPFPLDEVRRSVRQFTSLVEAHLRTPLPDSGAPRPKADRPSYRQRLLLEHDRFRASVTELRQLLTVVEADDHGGHRQALGQYGRILVEALRLHQDDERALATEAARRGSPRGAGPTARNHN